jgi:hypothetical protein
MFETLCDGLDLDCPGFAFDRAIVGETWLGEKYQHRSPDEK